MAERTPKQNAVHKADVKVGSTYVVKVSGRIVPVTIQERRVEEGDFRKAKRVTWKGMNQQTGKSVFIRSAAKLRYELVWSGPVDLNTKQGGRWVRKDSPIVFTLVEPSGGLLPASAACYPHGTEVRRDVTPDELRSLCGEDAAEQCQEFEDESGRWQRV